MRRISDIAIAKKIYGLVGALFMLVVAVAGTLIWILRDTDAQYANLVKHDTVLVAEQMRIRGDLQNFGRQMNNVLLLTNPPQGLDPLEQSLKALLVGMRDSQTLVAKAGGSPAFLTELTEALGSIESTSKATVAVQRLATPEHDAEARAVWGGPGGRATVVKIYDEIAKKADMRLADMNDKSKQYAHRTDVTSVVSFLVIGLGLVTAAGCAFMVATLGITRPLAALGSTMRRLADKDLEVEIVGANRKDEVGVMAQAVQVFKDNALQVRAMEQEQKDARQRYIEEEARTKAEAEQAAAELVVGSIGTGLEHLAAGDLTYRLDTPLPPAYEKLRIDLNAAMAQLQDLIRGILGNTTGLRSGTNEITQAADDLSRRTEQQAASLEQTAAALDEITGTVRKTSEGAKQARDVVVQTKTDAESSGNIVRGAVTAMGEIERSSQQISQIIGVIDEIAFQTNLLALNAGVEAARAGDAGRGFAVVASEVRALAQRSAEAAKEIKSLISASAQQVGSGVKLVGETGQALERIVAQIAQLNGVVSSIASSAHEQATGLQEVNTAVNQMDQVTQQNAAMVEQTTAAAHSLAEQTEELVQLTSRFRVELDSDRQKTGPVSAAAKPRPANKSTPQSVSSRKPQTVTRPRLVAANAKASHNWEEF